MKHKHHLSTCYRIRKCIVLFNDHYHIGSPHEHEAFPNSTESVVEHAMSASILGWSRIRVITIHSALLATSCSRIQHSQTRRGQCTALRQSFQFVRTALSARSISNSAKSSDTKAALQPTAESSIEKKRNFGIIAHIDAGKTTLTERFLHHSGFIPRPGNVDDGDTVTDFLPEERQRGITIQSAAISFRFQDHSITLIDTPGHVDFTIEVERALRVMDGAVVLIDAVAGVQAQTETVWRQARRCELPIVAFVNKLDRVGADLQKSLKSMRKSLACNAVCLQSILPNSRGVVDLVEGVVVDWGGNRKGSVEESDELSDAEKNSAVSAREELIEKMAELDEDVMEAWCGVGGASGVTPELLRNAIRKATFSRTMVPVLCGSALKDYGVKTLLRALVRSTASARAHTLLQTSLTEIFACFSSSNLCFSWSSRLFLKRHVVFLLLLRQYFPRLLIFQARSSAV